MARNEADREDLIAEATALVERVEFQVLDEPELLVAGFHRDGRFSIYFGPDPVYHFDPEGRLRRAFVDGNLYRSRGDTLSRLTRARSASSTSLLRHDLDPEDLSSFMKRMKRRLDRLQGQFDRGAIVALRQFPTETDVTSRVRQTLCGLSNEHLARPLKG